MRVGGMLLGLVLLAILSAGCSTPLGDAAFRGDVETVRKLLDQGANVNETNLYECDWLDGTALHCAAGQGNVEVARLLLDRGADINAKRSWGYTPLMLAAWFGRAEMVRFLLDRGADPTVVGRDGYTAAKLAQEVPGGRAGTGGGHASIVRLLEQSEAQRLGIAPPAQAAVTSAAPPALTVPSSDVDQLPVKRAKARSNAYAVVIGIEQYREKLPKADFADRDAKLMGEYLTKTMGYPEQNVVVRLNDRATRTDLVKYFEDWLRNNVEAGGSVFIYYSGHGAPNSKTGDAYLVPYDGDPAFVESTAYPLKQLYASLNKLPAKDVTVVLDSCFSGAGGRSVIAEGARPMMLSVENPVLAGNKTVVLAASSGSQISSTFKEQGHGLLTYYFLKGLQGAADGNQDGSVSLAEVFDYVKPNVQKVARKQYNNEQTPQLLGNPELLSKGVKLIERAP